MTVCEGCPYQAAIAIAESKIPEKTDFYRNDSQKEVAVGGLSFNKKIFAEILERTNCPGAQVSAQGFLVCPMEGPVRDAIMFIQGPNAPMRSEWKFEVFAGADDEKPNSSQSTQPSGYL